MKKTKKLTIKKVTLRNLDEPTLDAMAGGEESALCNTDKLVSHESNQRCTCVTCDTCATCLVTRCQ